MKFLLFVLLYATVSTTCAFHHFNGFHDIPGIEEFLMELTEASTTCENQGGDLLCKIFSARHGCDGPFARACQKSCGLCPTDKLKVVPGVDCHRNCSNSDTPLACVWRFDISWAESMDPAWCGRCPNVTADCFNVGCIPADGVRRLVQVVNNQLPGPTLQVCEGDQVVVEVRNLMVDGQSVIMHWHGMEQAETPWMDGSSITQCPIDLQQRFRYSYPAATRGSLLYHSHTKLQTANGIWGSLIVRVADDPHGHLYDFDEHVIAISDWNHVVSLQSLYDFKRTSNDFSDNFLINGLGRFEEDGNMPISRFTVQPNKRYRMRILSSVTKNCPFQFSIDGHDQLSMIALDGSPIQPLGTETLTLHATERIDIVLESNAEPGAYWIKVIGLHGCNISQVAVLQYTGFEGEDPDAAPVFELDDYSFNGLNLKFPVTTAIADKSVANGEDISGEPDHHVHLSLDWHETPSTIFSNGVPVTNENGVTYFPMVNNGTLPTMPSPLLSQLADIDPSFFCTGRQLHECKTTDATCNCVSWHQIKTGDLVEVLMVTIGRLFDGGANHPMHLHNYHFNVLAIEVENMDRNGELQRNFDNPPLKDTLMVPDRGYAIIRFRATVPGIWLFHSQLEADAAMGMSTLFSVGKWPKVPVEFPRCGDYNLSPRNPAEKSALVRKKNLMKIIKV